MVWHLSLDRHRESVLVAFADLLTGPASRRALAQRDITAVYRMLRDAGISQASIADATGQKQSEVSEIRPPMPRPLRRHALRGARDSYEAARDEPRPWKHFASTLPHVEGCTYFALRRFDHAAAALSVAINGAGHAALCTVNNRGLLAAAQLRCSQLQAGLTTATRVVGLSKRLQSVSIRGSLAPLQEAAAARRDPACQDLAREVATLRGAA